MKETFDKSVAGLVSVLAVLAMLALPFEVEAQQALPPAIVTNLPWTPMTNSQTFTFPLTNGPLVSVPNGISYGNLANSNWFGGVNTAFTNGWGQVFRGRGMQVWFGVQPTNSTATNTLVAQFVVATGNGSAGDVYGNNAIVNVTNTVNAAGTNVSSVLVPATTIDNVGFFKLLSLQLIQTNSSIQAAVWTSIIP